MFNIVNIQILQYGHNHAQDVLVNAQGLEKNKPMEAVEV